jgi:hypothetical protein
MKELPVRVDWPAVFRNIEERAGLCPQAVCRVAHVNHALGNRLRCDPTHEPRYSKVAPILNLHLRLLPERPIPERK